MRQNIDIHDVEKNTRYVVDLGRPDAMVAKVWVNGQLVDTRMWRPFEVDTAPFVRQGTNEVTVELVGTNRNLLGPHHLMIGESYFVGPSSFTKTGGWTEGENLGKPIWKDRYCFVRFGL